MRIEIDLSDELVEATRGHWMRCTFSVLFPAGTRGPDGILIDGLTIGPYDIEADVPLHDNGSLHLPGWNTSQIVPGQYAEGEVKGTNA